MIDGAIRSLRCSYTASSAVLVDVGIINEQDSCMVIELSKIRRERQTSRKSLQSDAFVANRLDYCCSLYAGLPACRLGSLDRVLRSAARLIGGIPKFGH